uniref:Uncharacterized protein n=1 Tax=Hyaloperonospora arabidopsidis (strain Emoy2) TaxID=559515 RepID=M4BKK3_HYAAE
MHEMWQHRSEAGHFIRVKILKGDRATVSGDAAFFLLIIHSTTALSRSNRYRSIKAPHLPSLAAPNRRLQLRFCHFLIEGHNVRTSSVTGSNRCTRLSV